MCGISGLLLRPGEAAEESQLQRMADRLSHRGPDAEGTFASRNLGLSHRRLKIIDLSEAANQPMFSRDGRISVVFNGEIYNFRELRHELESRGRGFRTRSDTEVLVQAFEEWGVDSFRRLNGIFSFGLADLREREPILYLVRDRFGTKPLYYARQQGRLAFASGLGPLLDLPWVPREVDPHHLFAFLKFSHVPCPDTILRGVNQVRPGTWLRAQNGDVREGLYWDPIEIARFSQNGTAERSEEDWLAELEAILLRVADRQIVSDVPLGCLLSGGIDSSLLTMACAAAGGRRLQTFSIGYREAEFDETPYAREVAEAFGTDHHELIVGPRDFLDLVPSIPTYFDQPLADPTLLSTLLLARFARAKVTVALSGDGGDELFFGYTYHQALHRLRALLTLPTSVRRSLFRGAEALLSWPLPGAGRLRIQQARKASEILQFRDEAELFSYFIGTIGPLRLDRLATLIVDKPDLSEPLMAGMMLELDGLPWDQKISQVFLRSFLPDTVLAKTDRATMAYGLEGRVPFLDNEMVAFSSRVPFHLKLHGGTKKYLLRRLLGRRLPGRISTRAKQGFSIPLRDWLRGELRYLLDEHLEEGRLRREGYFEAGAVRDLVAQHLGRRANHSHLLWSIISFQLWKQQHLS